MHWFPARDIIGLTKPQKATMRALVSGFALATAVVIDASEKPEELVWGANMCSGAGTLV